MTLLAYFQRVKYKNGATECLGGIAFDGKVGDVNIYSVILVTNSYGQSWDSSCESQSRNIESQI